MHAIPPVTASHVIDGSSGAFRIPAIPFLPLARLTINAQRTEIISGGHSLRHADAPQDSGVCVDCDSDYRPRYRWNHSRLQRGERSVASPAALSGFRSRRPAVET